MAKPSPGVVFDKLFDCYGPQHWWPADSPFEVIVGAMLTQNTAWVNVERAIGNLRQANALAADAILHAPPRRLAQWLKPSGYFNVKAKRLQHVCAWYLQHGEYAGLVQWETPPLRESLLSVHGVGFETADDILLYAFSRPVFVIDAYTRRIFNRLDLIAGDESYEELRGHIERSLRRRVDTVAIYNEFHALIVRHAKEVCKVKPDCDKCVLRRYCARKGLSK